MKQYSKGFTLVELVVVIAIIGILAGIAIPMYTDATATARGARIIADMRTLQSAYTMYVAKEGQQIVASGGQGGFNTQIKVSELVDKRYLDAIPVPPEGKAIFPNAKHPELNITSYGFGDKKDAPYYEFYNHEASSDPYTPFISLTLGGMQIPLDDLLPQK